MNKLNVILARKKRLEDLYCVALVENKQLDVLFYSSQLTNIDRFLLDQGYFIEPLIISSDDVKHGGEKKGLTSPPRENVKKMPLGLTYDFRILGFGGGLNVKY